MKKLIIISIMIMSTMTMSAELRLLHTLPQAVTPQYSSLVYYASNVPNQQYVTSIDTTSTTITIHVYDLKTFTEETHIVIDRHFPTTYSYWDCEVYLIYKNFWNNDDAIYALIYEQNDFQSAFFLYKDNGELIQTFGSSLEIFATEDGYILIDIYKSQTKIYEIPGNGTSDFANPTAPMHNSNARKVIENGQLYIILDGVKYAVTGSCAL